MQKYKEFMKKNYIIYKKFFLYIYNFIYLQCNEWFLDEKVLFFFFEIMKMDMCVSLKGV